MQRRSGVVAVLAAVLAVILGNVSCGHQAPQGQDPLQNLAPPNVVEIKNAFNAS